MPPITWRVVLLSWLQTKGRRHANEMQMQNIYSSCADESNNIVLSNWGRPRFAVRPWYVRLMTSSVPVLLHLQVLLLLLLLRYCIRS